MFIKIHAKVASRVSRTGGFQKPDVNAEILTVDPGLTGRAATGFFRQRSKRDSLILAYDSRLLVCMMDVHVVYVLFDTKMSRKAAPWDGCERMSPLRPN
jgi:hypothetical protein